MAKPESSKVTIKRTTEGKVTSLQVNGAPILGAHARIGSSSPDEGATSVDELIIVVPLARVTVEADA